MRELAIFLLAFLVLAVESPLLHKVSMAAYAPDLVLVFTLYVGLTTRFQRGLFLALGLGLIKDAFAPATPVGMFMVIMVITFLMTYKVSVRLVLRGPVGVVLITAVASLGASLLELLLSLVFDRAFGAGERGAALVLGSMLPQALLTAPFAPVTFWLTEKLDGLMTRKGESIYL